MTYRISRAGQVFGPYTLAEVQYYLATGNIAPDDLAQADGVAAWIPAAQLSPAQNFPGSVPAQTLSAEPPPSTFASASAPTAMATPIALFPDPPDLPWWVALLLEIFTAGLFFVIWDMVEAAWLRKVERSSLALLFYAIAALVFLGTLPSSVHQLATLFFDAPVVLNPYTNWVAGSGFLIRLVARFVFRAELLHHFNRREPIGLRLNWFLTLVFGGLYFQYHFNRINALKRELRLSLPTA